MTMQYLHRTKLSLNNLSSAVPVVTLAKSVVALFALLAYFALLLTTEVIFV